LLCFEKCLGKVQPLHYSCKRLSDQVSRQNPVAMSRSGQTLFSWYVFTETAGILQSLDIYSRRSYSEPRVRVFMSQYHPLSDLQHDWETFVVNTVKTQDGKEMRVRDHMCAMSRR
jgi:hypothetical protein